jgi:hypothetical protein
MEAYIIQEKLKNSPGICYYPETNTVEITGRSIPEDPAVIFAPLKEWIDSHFQTNKSLDLYFKLEYINSGSAKYLLNILNNLAERIIEGKSVKIKWIYEEDDETILELGENYRDNTGIPIEIELAK